MPADIIGTQIYRPDNGSFEVNKGPIFNNIILADEINRAPAKVQSALLEAMQAAIPIVATKVGEVPWVLKNGRLGEIVQSKNPEALANAIEKVYKNIKTVQKNAILARSVVLNELSVEKMARDYLRLYQILVTTCNTCES